MIAQNSRTLLCFVVVVAVVFVVVALCEAGALGQNDGFGLVRGNGGHHGVGLGGESPPGCGRGARPEPNSFGRLPPRGR